MPNAICISCGFYKIEPWHKCPSCGFDRSSNDLALAKSVYMSIGRYETQIDKDRYHLELEKMAQEIRKGTRIDYDKKELNRLLHQKQIVDSISLFTVVKTAFRIFLPGILFLGLLVAVYFLFRLLRN